MSFFMAALFLNRAALVAGPKHVEERLITCTDRSNTLRRYLQKRQERLSTLSNSFRTLKILLLHPDGPTNPYKNRIKRQSPLWAGLAKQIRFAPNASSRHGSGCSKARRIMGFWLNRVSVRSKPPSESETVRSGWRKSVQSMANSKISCPWIRIFSNVSKAYTLGAILRRITIRACTTTVQVP